MPEIAAEFARLVASGDVKKSTYVSAGGQPGHLAAWKSEEANRLVGGFFRDTVESMEAAFLRPRHPGHRRFQEEAGVIVQSCVWLNQIEPEECLRALHRRAEALLDNS